MVVPGERHRVMLWWPPGGSPLEPKHVLVTGASSGLGRGLALHYARTGAVVHALARRKEALESLAAEVQALGAPGRVLPVALDVTDSEAHAAAIEAAHRASGRALDLVIANAGMAEPTLASRMDWRVVKRILDVNATAACVTIAAALPAMVARGAGTVVAVSSLAGLRGMPGSAAYCASKAALRVFMESVRVDLRGTGVTAIAILPGFVRTELTARNRFPMPFLMELEAGVQAMADGIRRGRAVVSFPLPLVAATRLAQALPRALFESLARHARPP